MDDGRVLFGAADHINGTARARITKGIGAPGDVLLSHKGTVGKVALAPDDAPAFVCSPQTTFWRTCDQERLDRRYLYAFMRSPGFHQQLASRAGETDMAPYVSLTAQRGLRVDLPPIDVQRSIGRILGALDDKIEVNRGMSEALEAMARSHYFARIQSPEATSWPIRQIADVATLTKGVSYRSADLIDGGDTALVTLKSVRRGGGYQPDGLKPYVGAYKPQQEVNSGDIVVAQTDVTQAAEVIGRPARVAVQPSFRHLVASLDLMVVRPSTARISREFIYLLLADDDFHDFAVSYTNGTTVLHLDVSSLPTYPFRLPPPSEVRSLTRFVGPLFARMDVANSETRTLASIRETLLPRLTSGELRIPRAGRLLAVAPT